VESAVRSPGLKLIFSPGRGGHQLFDLAADPLEQADIFAAGHRMAGTMVDRLDRYLDEAAAVPVVAPPPAMDWKLSNYSSLRPWDTWITNGPAGTILQSFSVIIIDKYSRSYVIIVVHRDAVAEVPGSGLRH
jgi:hypothetical protein